MSEDLWSEAKGAWKALMNSGKPVIYLGAASCGRAAGALVVKRAIQRELKDHSIDAQIIDVGCIGPCFMEPLVYIQLPGEPPVVYNNVTTADVPRLIQKVIIDGAHLKDKAVGVLAPHAAQGERPSLGMLNRPHTPESVSSTDVAARWSTANCLVVSAGISGASSFSHSASHAYCLASRLN